MRVLIVDDHELVRRGICTVLGADASIEICGEAFDGQEAVEKAMVLRPDAVVMDISMPRMNGLEATREIKRLLPETDIVIVSQYEVPEMVRQATNAGARAYVAKSAISSELLDVLAKIRKREPFVQVVGLTDENPDLDAQQILQQSATFEKALRESEERFRAIVETTPECVKLVAADGTLLQMNSSGLNMVGADSCEAVVGKNVYDIIAPHHRAMYREFNERICGGEKGSLEFDIVGLKGACRHMETHAAPLRMPDGTTVHLAVTRDITERTRAEREIQESEQRLRVLADGLESQVHLRTQELEERNAEILHQSEQLRELSNRLLQSQDEERRRIARELHDGVGQLLAALGMNLANLEQEKASLSPSACKILGESAALIEQASQEIRTMSHLLHPPLLDEVGLESALRWYVDGFTERSKVTVTLQLAPDFSQGLSRDLALSLFRVVQECLTNVHRHSGSASATVGIDRTANTITLSVKDDGAGIPAEMRSRIASGESGGVGLRGIRERVLQFGGGLEVHSDHGGTQIVAVLPIPATAVIDHETTNDLQVNEKPAQSSAMEHANGNSATILCIDDETSGLLPRKLLLESAGHRVITARSGAEGIEIFRSEKVDAVILDYWMAEMKGTAVAWELKRIDPTVPVIVLSGVSELPGEAAGLVDQWLVKGSHRAEKLLDSISTLLEHRSA
jgi:PAS domain S-box-containing protein